MTKNCLFLSLLAFLFVQCTTPVVVEEPEVDLYAPLTEVMDSIATHSLIPGFSVGMVDYGRVVYTEGFGFQNLEDSIPFTDQTVNCVASISKTVIGFSVAKLVDEGKLSLDMPVNDILPFEVIHPMYPETAITLRHLVTHTAGLTDSFDPEEVGEADINLIEEITYEDDSIQVFMNEELAYYRMGIPLSQEETLQRYLDVKGKWYSEENYEAFEPGTQYSYSNIGSELAAVIVEIVAGKPFHEYTEEILFTPLGMTNTAWFNRELPDSLVTHIYMPDDWDDPQESIRHPRYEYTAYASGGIKTSAHDLGLYLEEMLKGARGNGTLLSKSGYQLLFTPQLNASHFPEERDPHPLNDEYNVGLFWSVSSTGMILHNGGSIGVFSFLYFDPNDNSGAWGFCNLPIGDFGVIRDEVFEFEV
ncbi:serine hydrolase domain-containing protein [Sanyastnella coralliicola]|uniref:serine hydrolase domain-containing protein n=1 Tax=Sanyastnella coralliicola TaxID=3069118 RepID=UPI0027BA5279|nr:serine hydrolase [Longitalea sp. SCSIO 12813]